MTANAVQTPDELMGEEIRQRRERLGLTQRELAERVSALGWPVDSTAITRVEKGQRAIRVAQLRTIAKALDVKASDLLVEEFTFLKEMDDESVRRYEKARRELQSAIVLTSSVAVALRSEQAESIAKNAGLPASNVDDYLGVAFATVQKIAEKHPLPVFPGGLSEDPRMRQILGALVADGTEKRHGVDREEA